MIGLELEVQQAVFAFFLGMHAVQHYEGGCMSNGMPTRIRGSAQPVLDASSTTVQLLFKKCQDNEIQLQNF